MSRKKAVPMCVSANVRCGGETHTVGITLAGRLTMHNHTNDEYEAMRSFMGEGDDEPNLLGRGEKTGGVRDIRCFYVMSQYRAFMETGRFYQIPQTLRPYLKITTDVRNRRKRARLENRPKARAKQKRYHAIHTRSERILRSPVCEASGVEIVMPSWSGSRTLVNGTTVVALRSQSSGFGCLVRDPESPTGHRIVLPPLSPCVKRGATGKKLKPIPYNPPPLLGFYNISPLRWWDFHSETP